MKQVGLRQEPATEMSERVSANTSHYLQNLVDTTHSTHDTEHNTTVVVVIGGEKITESYLMFNWHFSLNIFVIEFFLSFSFSLHLILKAIQPKFNSKMVSVVIFFRLSHH